MSPCPIGPPTTFRTATIDTTTIAPLVVKSPTPVTFRLPHRWHTSATTTKPPLRTASCTAAPCHSRTGQTMTGWQQPHIPPPSFHQRKSHDSWNKVDHRVRIMTGIAPLSVLAAVSPLGVVFVTTNALYCPRHLARTINSNQEQQQEAGMISLVCCSAVGRERRPSLIAGDPCRCSSWGIAKRIIILLIALRFEKLFVGSVTHGSRAKRESCSCCVLLARLLAFPGFSNNTIFHYSLVTTETGAYHATFPSALTTVTFATYGWHPMRIRITAKTVAFAASAAAKILSTAKTVACALTLICSTITIAIQAST
jgi:hypothetical protein